jgi:DNA repair ATPase RecN
MAQWVEVIISVVTIICGFAVSISLLKRGQSDTRVEIGEIRVSIKDMTKAVERLATMAEVHEDRLRSSLIQVDELKGDIKRHGREIQVLLEWKAAMEERMKSFDCRYRGAGD